MGVSVCSMANMVNGSGSCSPGTICCKNAPTSTSTPRPTATPAPSSGCETTCQGETGSFYTNCMATCQKTATLAPNNSSCSSNADCQSNNCQTIPGGKYCLPYGQTNYITVAANGTCGTNIYNHECVAGYSCQSNVCKLIPSPTPAPAPNLFDAITSIFNNFDLDIYSKISQCDSKPTKSEQDACYQQAQYQAMTALSNTGNGPGSITAYDFEGQNQCKTDPNSQACKNYQKYATARAAIGTAPAAIYGSAATLPLAAAYGTAAMNSIPAWATRGLAALNLIDDSIATAQCLLAKDPNACAQLAASMLNPLPGARFFGDAPELFNAFRPRNTVRNAASSVIFIRILLRHKRFFGSKG
jgi:hypothetical protein